jgi:sulfur-carrier protein
MNQATTPQTNQTVSIRVFGAFRQFGPNSTVDLTVPQEARVVDLRQAMQNHFAGNDNALALLKASAFATDKAVLDDEDPVPRDEAVSVLPPVCGG